jgi:hypothetical protein
MAQITKVVTAAVPPPVKAAVVTAVPCHPVAVGTDERNTILGALAPIGTFPAGQFAVAATFVPFGGFATVVVVA